MEGIKIILSKIRAKLEKFWKWTGTVDNGEYELNPDEQELLDGINAFNKVVNGPQKDGQKGKGTKIGETVHGPQKSNKPDEELNDVITNFERRVHGGNVVPTVKVDEKTARETAKGKVPKKGPKVLGDV